MRRLSSAACLPGIGDFAEEAFQASSPVARQSAASSPMPPPPCLPRGCWGAATSGWNWTLLTIA
jgi:hypothetical protein